MTKPTHGIVAAGHPQTAEAAQFALSAGGNAFDAAIAAFFTACVVEPALASLGGGGFLIAQSNTNQALVYDFFCHTPINKRQDSGLDFYPMDADFGTKEQLFNIGLGSVATPGAIKGMCQIHQELASLPLKLLLEPAINLARNGTPINQFQSGILEIIKPIYLANAETKKTYASPNNPDQVIQANEQLIQPELAEAFEALSSEGEGLFYQGEIANSIAQLCQQQGGHLTLDDLKQYQVIKRPALTLNYRTAKIWSNPSPAAGGAMIAFPLQLLNHHPKEQMQFGSLSQIQLLYQTLAATHQARINQHAENPIVELDPAALLDPQTIAHYHKHIMQHPKAHRGTTHISIIDQFGNKAGLTASNGEGSGCMIPNTGIMLNNMLGEEDLSPQGFQQWPCNTRLSSMMAPSIIHTEDGRNIVLGSGGSNRIRSAILQVLINLIDSNMGIEQAIESPRIHTEHQHIDCEKEFSPQQIALLKELSQSIEVWQHKSVFFGGVHAVQSDAKGHLTGAGDSRRGGVCI